MLLVKTIEFQAKAQPIPEGRWKRTLLGTGEDNCVERGRFIVFHTKNVVETLGMGVKERV